MAKIKMDMSEWEAMKKVQKLLEESLAKEKSLRSKVENLQKEKIDALKSNEKIVTIHKKVTTSETIQCKISPHHIVDRIKRAFAENRSSRIDDFMNHGHQDYSNHRMDVMQHDEVKELCSYFFTEKHELKDSPELDNITYKGLDQVKADIAKDYEESMSEQHKEIISSHKDLVKELNVLQNEKKENKIIISNNNKIIKGLEQDVDQLLNKNILLLEEQKALKICKNAVSLTRGILNENRSFMINGKILKRLDELWKKKD